MLKLLWVIPLIGVFFLLSSCEGHYRYPCQDPANWGNIECNNEVCKAEGSCTDDVLGKSSSPFGSTFEQTNDREETTGTCSPEISSNVESDEDDYVPVAKVPSRIVPKSKKVEKLFDEDDIPSRTPNAFFEEEVLTNNTVVDTAAHDAATM